jgi:hypothetical protein
MNLWCRHGYGNLKAIQSDPSLSFVNSMICTDPPVYHNRLLFGGPRPSKEALASLYGDVPTICPIRAGVDLPDKLPEDFGQEHQVREPAQNLNKRVKALVAHLVREEAGDNRPTAKPTLKTILTNKPSAAVSAKAPHPFVVNTSAKRAPMAEARSGAGSIATAATPKVTQESDESTTTNRLPTSSSAPTGAKAGGRVWWSKPARAEPECAQPKAPAGSVVGIDVDPIEDMREEAGRGDVHAPGGDGVTRQSTADAGVVSRFVETSPAKPSKADMSPAASQVPNNRILACLLMHSAAACGADCALQAHSLQPTKHYDLQATQAAMTANQPPKTLLKQSSVIRPEPKHTASKPSADPKSKAPAPKPASSSIMNFFAKK